ncbi:24326_t:CDS:1, partial [Gigaspora margarita]
TNSSTSFRTNDAISNRTSTTRTSKVVDLVSSDKSKTDCLVSSNYDIQENDYFQDDDDNNRVNLVIKYLLTMSATSFKKKS